MAKQRKPRKREPMADKITVDEASRGKPTEGVFNVLAKILVDIYLQERAEEQEVSKATNV